MDTSFILYSVIIVAILFLAGIIYTFKEFKTMEENPSEFRRDRPEEPDVVEEKEST